MACFSRHEDLSPDERKLILNGQASFCEFCVHGCYLVELGQNQAKFEACLIMPDREREVLDCSAFEHHKAADALQQGYENEEVRVSND